MQLSQNLRLHNCSAITSSKSVPLHIRGYPHTTEGGQTSVSANVQLSETLWRVASGGYLYILKGSDGPQPTELEEITLVSLCRTTGWVCWGHPEREPPPAAAGYRHQNQRLASRGTETSNCHPPPHTNHTPSHTEASMKEHVRCDPFCKLHSSTFACQLPISFLEQDSHVHWGSEG